MNAIRELFTYGVYNEHYHNPLDGGPVCASESTFGFKAIITLILLPLHIYGVSYGVSYISRLHEQKKAFLIKSGRGLAPSFVEYVQGIMCFVLLSF